MVNKLNNSAETLSQTAEGTTEGKESREPYSALQTSTLPAIRAEGDKPLGATGTLSEKVRMQAEGKDSSNQNREANVRSSDETMPAATPDARARLAQAMKAGKKYRVLIVEDTTELAEVIQATLENIDLQTEWVSHGNKALERIKQNKPDLVLLDIGLPDMTGWKVLETLRESWKKEDMPTIVVITAYGDPANRLIGKLQGIHSYLIKPFTSDEVEKVVQRALSDNAK